jgi:hypothetical protein
MTLIKQIIAVKNLRKPAKSVLSAFHCFQYDSFKNNLLTFDTASEEGEA